MVATHILLGIFTPSYLGKIESILRVAYFSNGVGEKPPTRDEILPSYIGIKI